MKRIYVILLALCFFTLPAIAQTYVDVTGGGGILSTPDSQIIVPYQVVIEYDDPTQTSFGGSYGHIVDLVTPVISGSLANGGTFGAGGGFTIVIPGYSFDGFTSPYPVTFTSGSWHKSTLANGTHYYELDASFVDQNGNNGALVFQTANIGTATWSTSTSASLVSADIVLILP